MGAKIFLMVLTAQPDIKAIFGLEKIPQGRLKYDPRFRQHAQVFTKTFDYVVKNLDYPEKIEQHFEVAFLLSQGQGDCGLVREDNCRVADVTTMNLFGKRKLHTEEAAPMNR